MNREAELEPPSRVACSDLLGHVFINTTKKQNPAVAMLPPCAALQSQNKGNKEPSVTNYHEHTERPQKHILSLVRPRMPKQTKASNSNKQAPAAAQSMNHWPPLRSLPVKAPQPHFSRTMSHSGLTSRAQARGTNQREPRSGTGRAIPRCLQRFVRPRRCHFTICLRQWQSPPQQSRKRPHRRISSRALESPDEPSSAPAHV